MNVERLKLIWHFADQVRDIMGLKIPISLDDMKRAISNIDGRCIEMNIQTDAIVVANDKLRKGRFIILYSKETNSSRILFSIACELGHLFLHLLNDDGTIAPETEDSRLSLDVNKEFESVEFAGEFLMPAHQFKDACNRMSNENVAEYFNISNSSVVARKKSLQMCRYELYSRG